MHTEGIVLSALVLLCYPSVHSAILCLLIAALFRSVRRSGVGVVSGIDGIVYEVCALQSQCIKIRQKALGELSIRACAAGTIKRLDRHDGAVQLVIDNGQIEIKCVYVLKFGRYSYCRLHKARGSRVRCGEIIGCAMTCSACEVYTPSGLELCVTPGDVMLGGLSVLCR